MTAGVMISIYRLACVELASFRKINVEHDRRILRHHLGYYILLGLEFIVVADVLQTIIHPGLDEIFMLGVVVLIRTVIGVTLNWELSRTEQIKEEHP
jgi:uncharacterized membrane protein